MALIEPKIINENEEVLTQALRYVMVIIGLRAQNYPDVTETKILLNFIAENYGGHTPSEIRLAFEMAITKKLDVEANCYENFSVAYFVSIMEAYRVWAREQVKLLPEPSLARILTEKEKSDINLRYALLLLKSINKLPCKLKL